MVEFIAFQVKPRDKAHIMVEFVQQLMDQIRSLTDQNIQMANQVESLTATVTELNGVVENHPEQTWAPLFKKLLLDMK